MEPTSAQLNYIRRLSADAGCYLDAPRTKRQASWQINRLKGLVEANKRPWSVQVSDQQHSFELHDDEVEPVSENESRMKWCHTADLPAYVQD